MRQVALSLTIIALALPFFAGAPAHALDPRTWVSGTGDDGNPCSRTAPCKTFATAIAKTASGGEINCLDPGSFGGVNIRKAITISCEAGTAGVQGTPLPGIFVFAGAGEVVTLRGLDIDGQVDSGVGIGIVTAKEVHIENCSIRNFRGNAIAGGIWIVGSLLLSWYVANFGTYNKTYGSPSVPTFARNYGISGSPQARQPNV